jgi:NADH-quinone oxidoreductase subunit M
MVAPLFITPISTIACILFSKVYFNVGEYNSRLFRIIALIALYFNLGYSTWLWNTFPRCLLNEAVLPAAVRVENGFLFEAQPTSGLPFIILSTFILIISLLTSWYASINSNVLALLLLTIEVCLVGAFSCTSLFVFLLFFELSALPIFVFIAYCGSPRRERVKAAYYFLLFTFYGSIALLAVLLNIYGLQQVSFLGLWISDNSGLVFWALLFVAFAVKIPLFPFHIWLPYAHVEASTTASIILAALLLKLGGYGVLKFLLPIFGISAQLFFQSAAIFICLVGLAYGAFCALRQIDMKRQIAFSSISHMSFGLLGIFTYAEIGTKGGLYLMISHGLTSAALFFLVGALSERYHSRSVFIYSGLIAPMPLFIFFLALISLANVGFPGTSGFVPEFFVLSGVVSSSLYLLFPTLFGMLITTAAGLLLVMRVAYGHLKAYSNFGFSDLTRLETYILGLLGALIIWLGLNDPWSGLFVGGLAACRTAPLQKNSTAGLAVLLVGVSIDGFLENSSGIFGFLLAAGPEVALFAGILWLLIRLNTYTLGKNTSTLFGVQLSAVLLLFVGLQLAYIVFSVTGFFNINKFFIVFILVGGAVLCAANGVWFARPRSLVGYGFSLVLIYVLYLLLVYFGICDLSKFSYLINGFTQSSKFALLSLYLLVFTLIGVYSKVKERITGKNLYEYTVIYWLILLFAIMLISIDNLVVFLIALEGVSLASYILPTLGQTRGGVVAAVKYFVFGTLGSIYLVWGVANIYAIFPSLSLTGLYSYVSSISALQSEESTFARAFQFLFVGFLIKLGGAPVHQWVPDVYSGSPLKITFLFSSFIKVLLFVVFWRFGLFLNTGGEVEFASGLSVLVGCYYTLKQKEVKRFLAYSSITHTGFLLLGDFITSGLYLFIYVVAIILFFSILFEYKLNKGVENDIVYLTDLRYLSIHNRPFHAFLVVVALVAMAGLPPLGGFYIKFWVFTTLIEDITLYGDVASYALFLIIFIVSIISMFYYMRALSYILIGSTSVKRPWSLWPDWAFGFDIWADYKIFRSIQVICASILIGSIFLVPGFISLLTSSILA